MDQDLGLKPLGQARELMGRAQVKTQTVADLDLTAAEARHHRPSSQTPLAPCTGGASSRVLREDGLLPLKIKNLAI